MRDGGRHHCLSPGRSGRTPRAAAIGVVAVLVGADKVAVKPREAPRADAQAELREPLKGSRKAHCSVTHGQRSWRENAHPRWTSIEADLVRARHRQLLFGLLGG